VEIDGEKESTVHRTAMKPDFGQCLFQGARGRRAFADGGERNFHNPPSACLTCVSNGNRWARRAPIANVLLVISPSSPLRQ